MMSTENSFSLFARRKQKKNTYTYRVDFGLLFRVKLVKINKQPKNGMENDEEMCMLLCLSRLNTIYRLIVFVKL